MKARVEVKLVPFSTPDLVQIVAEQGSATYSSVKLSALDAHTLEELCDQWRDEVFKKSGLRDPALDRAVAG